MTNKINKTGPASKLVQLKKGRCISCNANISERDRIVVLKDGALQDYPLCSRHRGAVARLMINTGKADEVFIPLPMARQSN